MRRRQEKIAEYVEVRPILKNCTCAERMEGSSMSIMWWDQEHAPKNMEREV